MEANCDALEQVHGRSSPSQSPMATCRECWGYLTVSAGFRSFFRFSAQQVRDSNCSLARSISFSAQSACPCRDPPTYDFNNTAVVDLFFLDWKERLGANRERA